MRYMVFDLPGAAGTFAARAAAIEAWRARWPGRRCRPCARPTLVDRAELQRRLEAVVAGGGEGLMLHRADASTYPAAARRCSSSSRCTTPRRWWSAMSAGAASTRAAWVRCACAPTAGIEFLLGTGFSDAERERPPPLGAVVTFSYRGTTAAGVPRFASFLRRRDDG